MLREHPRLAPVTARGRAACFVAALTTIAAQAGGFTAVAEQSDVQFMRETTMVSQGTAYSSLSLSRDARIETIDMVTGSYFAAIFLVGPVNFRVLKAGEWQSPPSGDLMQSNVTLRAGFYFVYAHSEGPLQMTFRFPELEGSTTVILDHPTTGFFEKLPSAGILAPSQQAILLRFSGGHIMEGTGITGLMVVTQVEGLMVEAYEYRWSTKEGVAFCFGGTWASTPTVGPSINTGLVYNMPAGEAALDFFRSSPSLTRSISVFGIWVQRAPGNQPSWILPIQRPPLWELGLPPYDAYCLGSCGNVIQTLVTTEVPSICTNGTRLSR